MNDNEQRDELASEITGHHIGDGYYSAIVSMGEAREIADDILAAGYRKPRTITERHEDNGADELPPLSVVISDGKPAIMQHDGTFMDHDGCSYDTWEMSYPMTVIHEPTTEATQ